MRRIHPAGHREDGHGRECARLRARCGPLRDLAPHRPSRSSVATSTVHCEPRNRRAQRRGARRDESLGAHQLHVHERTGWRCQIHDDEHEGHGVDERHDGARVPDSAADLLAEDRGRSRQPHRDVRTNLHQQDASVRMPPPDRRGRAPLSTALTARRQRAATRLPRPLPRRTTTRARSRGQMLRLHTTQTRAHRPQAMQKEHHPRTMRAHCRHRPRAAPEHRSTLPRARRHRVELLPRPQPARNPEPARRPAARHRRRRRTPRA